MSKPGATPRHVAIALDNRLAGAEANATPFLSLSVASRQHFRSSSQNGNPRNSYTLFQRRLRALPAASWPILRAHCADARLGTWDEERRR